MSDTISALLGGTGSNPKIKKKGSKFVVEGVNGEFDTYEAAVAAMSPDPLHGQGPMMTSGESAMDYGDEQEHPSQQPSAKAPNSAATPSTQAPPAKPEWVVQSERRAGIEYEWNAQARDWRPKKGITRGEPSAQA